MEMNAYEEDAVSSKTLFTSVAVAAAAELITARQATAARRIAVPVADAQFRVNTAASARSFRYAGSVIRLRSTGVGTTG